MWNLPLMIAAMLCTCISSNNFVIHAWKCIHQNTKLIQILLVKQEVENWKNRLVPSVMLMMTICMAFMQLCTWLWYFRYLHSQGHRCQENLHLKILSVYVVSWIFLQTFQTYFCMQANSVDPDQTAPKGAVWSGFTLFAKIIFKITSRWQSRRQMLWLAVYGLQFMV